jgi:hypothetical protein
MSDYDWDEIEAALASAEERGLLSERGRSLRSPEQTTILQRYNDRIGALAAEDRSDLDQIREEYQAEGRRFNEAEKDMAIERSSGRLAMLRSRVAASREATEDIMSRGSQAPDSKPRRDRIVLELARGIRTKGGLPGEAHTVLDQRDSALEPWANRASVSDRWPSEIVGLARYEAGVGFPFVWTNPYPYSVVLDVESAVALNGFCYVGADPGINTGGLDVTTFLQPSLPFDTGIPPFQSGQTVLAGRVSAYGGGYLGVGEIDSLNVAGYYGMSYHKFTVPGGQRAVFEAGSIFRAGSGHGHCHAEANFSSGDFQVMCPAVTLTILWHIVL